MVKERGAHKHGEEGLLGSWRPGWQGLELERWRSRRGRHADSGGSMPTQACRR